jgi:molecular chaperone GrpE (heat shock protein)
LSKSLDAEPLLAELKSLRAAMEEQGGHESSQQRAFDQLYEELKQYKEDFIFQSEKPLLLDLLLFYDVIPMETPEKFDRKVQKAIKTVETTDPSVENTIHQILKRGFLRAGRLLRAEEVVVNRLPGSTGSNS